MLIAHRLRSAAEGEEIAISKADVEWVRDVLPSVNLGDLWNLVLFGSEDSFTGDCR